MTIIMAHEITTKNPLTELKLGKQAGISQKIL